MTWGWWHHSQAVANENMKGGWPFFCLFKVFYKRDEPRHWWDIGNGERKRHSKTRQRRKHKDKMEPMARWAKSCSIRHLDFILCDISLYCLAKFSPPVASPDTRVLAPLSSSHFFAVILFPHYQVRMCEANCLPIFHACFMSHLTCGSNREVKGCSILLVSYKQMS